MRKDGRLMGHFWYSESQHEIDNSFGDYRRTYCIIDGKRHEYSMMADTKDHEPKFDDIIYLGYGEYDGN